MSTNAPDPTWKTPGWTTQNQGTVGTKPAAGNDMSPTPRPPGEVYTTLVRGWTVQANDNWSLVNSALIAKGLPKT